MEDKHPNEIVKAKNTDASVYNGKSIELSESTIQAMTAFISEGTQLARAIIDPVFDAVGRDIDKDMQAELKDIEGYYELRRESGMKVSEQIEDCQKQIGKLVEKISGTNDPSEIEQLNKSMDRLLSELQGLLNSHDVNVEKEQKHRREESEKRNKSIFSRIFGK